MVHLEGVKGGDRKAPLIVAVVKRSFPSDCRSHAGTLRSLRRIVGALPQTPPEALPLDSARGNRPLTLFAFELSAPSCNFRVKRVNTFYFAVPAASSGFIRIFSFFMQAK